MDVEHKRIMRLPEVLRLTGLSKSLVYEMVGEDRFPQQVKVGKRARGWRARDVADWLESRPPADSPQESD